MVNKREGAEFKDSTHHGPIWINKFSSVVRSDLGAYVTIGLFSFVADSHFGNYISVGSRTSIGAFSHPLDLFSTSEVSHRDTTFFFGESLFEHESASLRRVTTIESDVYIGDNAVLRSGVRIGTGGVVGAGSVVTKDVEPFWIVAGNPARPIRRRFSDSLCNYILSTEWWELTVSELSKSGLWSDINARIREG